LINCPGLAFLPFWFQF